MSYASSSTAERTITIGVSSSGAAAAPMMTSRGAVEDRSPACRRPRVVNGDDRASRAPSLPACCRSSSRTRASCGASATHRHLLVDEGDRSVLHFAGRIALGVDVRDLLQLQRAFEGDRIVDPAAEIQEVGPVVEPAPA